MCGLLKGITGVRSRAGRDVSMLSAKSAPEVAVPPLKKPLPVLSMRALFVTLCWKTARF